MKIPKLVLIGAGPGDPELITLKAVKALKEAEVILYDALVNPELLDYAKPEAELIFVGKRKGCYAYAQDQIHELIVQRAYAKGLVVRLKGGDPFVFGRGSEEQEFAIQHKLEVEVIPGISSSMAVPALQNIPLTQRGQAESFWVITGTTRDHRLSDDIRLAAKSNATVIVLMGTAKLDEIVAVFKVEGRHDLPVAIIQNGTRKDERVGIGTVETIAEVYQNLKLGNPAIIVLGHVVAHRTKLQNLLQAQELGLQV